MADLPTIAFGDAQITRLISGGNPLVGNSHFSPELDREMADYFTEEEVVRYCGRLVSNGINVLQARGDYRVMHWLELFKREGGSIAWIAQTASEMADVFDNIRVIAAAGAIGIYHHGTTTDNWWLEGRIDRVRDYLRCMRDQGVQVGLGTHIPEVIEYAEEKGWDVDFYMAALYNINRVRRESAAVTGEFQGGEEYADEDPVRMCEAIRATGRTCLAFKILAAGRRCETQDTVRDTIRWVASSIKPTDAIVVGMFDKHVDQIPLNVQYAAQAFRAQQAASAS